MLQKNQNKLYEDTEMFICTQIEPRSYCLDNVGLWKPEGTPSSPRVKACSDTSNWMDIVQKRTHAAVRCPLPKVFRYEFLRSYCLQNILISLAKIISHCDVHFWGTATWPQILNSR